MVLYKKLLIYIFFKRCNYTNSRRILGNTRKLFNQFIQIYPYYIIAQFRTIPNQRKIVLFGNNLFVCRQVSIKKNKLYFNKSIRVLYEKEKRKIFEHGELNPLNIRGASFLRFNSLTA